MLAQQVEYLKPPYDSLNKLLVRLKEIGAERYAGILHDKDSGEKPHIHVFMHFANGREVVAIAKKLNIAPQKNGTMVLTTDLLICCIEL